MSLKIDAKVKKLYLHNDKTELKSIRSVKALIKNNKIEADIIYQATKKIVISLKNVKNLELLKIENINEHLELQRAFVNACHYNNGALIEIENAHEIKGVGTEFFIFFDFTKKNENVSYDYFERLNYKKDVPFVSRNLQGFIAFNKKPEHNIEEINKLKNHIERDFKNFYESDYFKIDNKVLESEINNARYEQEKVLRNKKLNYLIKFSFDTQPIYNTLEYLTNKFDLNKAQDLWIIIMRRCWEERIQYDNNAEKCKYFNMIDYYFGDHEKYLIYFKDLKKEQFKQKLELF
tara:strand:+ start:5503 stop:6375 length:873 start_codon:yes stop_codon:yes gene_type:complete